MQSVRCILALAPFFAASVSADGVSVGDREAHAIYEIVARTAIETVPAGIRPFLSAHAEAIQKDATAVAIQHAADSQREASSHYVILDVAATAGDPTARRQSALAFPHDRRQAAELYKRLHVSQGGTLPWEIAAHFELLVRAFESGEENAILHEVAMLAHFAADAALPFNTTAERDGADGDPLCQSKRGGSESTGPQCTARVRCQNALVEMRRSRFEYEVRVWPGRFRAPAEPLDAIFATLIESHESLGILIQSDEALRHELGITDLESFQENRSSFYDGLASRAGSTMEERLESGALLAANLIGAAWIRAGRPSERFFSDSKTGNGENAPQYDPSAAFVGSLNSGVFHRSDCPHVQRIRPENLVHFPTPAAAVKAGRTPCRQCKPEESAP